MNEKDREFLKLASRRIKDLASLDRFGLPVDKRENERIKILISPYMDWFKAVAFQMEAVANKNADIQEESERLFRQLY